MGLCLSQVRGGLRQMWLGAGSSVHKVLTLQACNSANGVSKNIKATLFSEGDAASQIHLHHSVCQEVMAKECALSLFHEGWKIQDGSLTWLWAGGLLR